MANVTPYGDPNAHGKLNDSLVFRRAQNYVSLMKAHHKQTTHWMIVPATIEAFKNGVKEFKKLWNKSLDWFKKKAKQKGMKPRSLYLQKYLKNQLAEYHEKVDITDIIDFGATQIIGSAPDEIYIDVKVLQPSTGLYTTIGTLEQSSNIYTPKAVAVEQGKTKLTFYTRQAIPAKYCILWNKFEELIAGEIPSDKGSNGVPNHTPTFSLGKFGNALATLTQANNIDFSQAIPDMGKVKISFWAKATGTALNVFFLKDGTKYLGCWMNYPTTTKLDVYAEIDGVYLFYRLAGLSIIQDEWFSIVLDVDYTRAEDEKIKAYFNKTLLTMGTNFSDEALGGVPININMMNLWSSGFNLEFDNLKIFSPDIPILEVLNNVEEEGLGSSGITEDIPVPFEFEIRAIYQQPLGTEKGMTIRTGELLLEPGIEKDIFLSNDLSTWHDDAGREMSAMI